MSNSLRVTNGAIIGKMTQTERDALASPESGLIIFNTTSSKYNFYNGTAWTDIGSGSGGGGINYFTNTDGETDTTGLTLFADGATLTDGTGGSPTATITGTAVDPLRDLGSFLYTPGALGDGLAIDFTIDAADKAKVLKFSMDYALSATITEGDYQIWFFDVTNSRLLQPAPYKISGTSGTNYNFTTTFQTSSDSTSYRFIIYQSVASPGSANVTLKFDNLSVGPQSIAYGAPVTDWQSYTPTGSWVSNTTYAGKWRRVGDSMELDVLVTTSGAPTAAQLTINLPSGYTIDTAKIGTTTDYSQALGYGEVRDASTASYDAVVSYTSTTSVRVTSPDGSAVPQLVPVTNTAPITFGASDTVSIQFKVPISGWSSSVQMSNDADTRVVAARAHLTSGTVNSDTSTPIAFGTVDYDTHGAWASNKFTAPVPGKYRVSMGAQFNSLQDATLYKNGAAYSIIGTPDSTNLWVFGTDTIELNAGDYIDIRAGAATVVSNTSRTHIAVERLSGTSAIAATDTVSAKYTLAGSNAITSSVPVQYSTKEWDYTGSYSAGVFTAPISGLYHVTASLYLAGAFTLYIYKNGVSYKQGIIGSAGTPSQVDGYVRLLTGETVDVRPDNSGNTAGTSVLHTLEINRVGNY